MRITPLDARKQEFGKAMRGYDCDEVQAFLNTLADEYEAVLVDNKQIRERVMEQEQKLGEYQGMERNLRDTLMTAERVMSETKETASREGDIILKDAEMKARGIMEECRMRTEELRREIVALRKEKETYLARFKSLAEAQIQFVESHKSDFDDLDRRLVDIVDSVVAGASKAETRPSPMAQAPTVAAKPATAPPVVNPTFPPTDTAMEQPTVEGPDPFAASPAPDSAPAENAGGEDMWRDYTPGNAAPSHTGDEAKQETTQGEEAVAIADLVSESLAETALEAQDQEVPKNEDSPEPPDSPEDQISFGDQNPTGECEQADQPSDETANETAEEKPTSIW